MEPTDTSSAAGLPAEQTAIPVWVVQLIGRLQLENELLRAQTQATSQASPTPPVAADNHTAGA